jgi:hypothetical protein
MMQNAAVATGKIFLYFVLMALSVAGLMAFVMPAAESALGMSKALPQMVALGIVNFVAMSVPAMLLMGLIDGKSPMAMGLHPRRSIGDFLTGGAVGAGIFAAALAAAVFGGWAEVDPDLSKASMTAMAVSAFGMTLAAAGEEVMMRGYILQELMSKFSTPVAVVVSSVLFAGLHGAQMAGSPMMPVAALNIFLASVMLSLAYLATRTLWLPIGLHAGWNVMQGPVLGINVSGTDIAATGWQPVTFTGPEMMTGGAFGFEASVLGLIGPTMGILMMLAMRRKAQ